jgi:hypothetical protein
MAISITWGTKVIYVPKADLTLIQASPEIRELDLDWFRLELKDLEDGEEGMCFPDTHRHVTETTLAGLTYARIVEIINGYTVEFEDGQYTVNCVGANHNVSDVKVANQVSLIINNAAGLINNAAIEYASFNGGVTVDLNNGEAGTIFPIGTPQRPVDNFADALLIASVRGFNTLYILGDATLDSGTDFSDYVVIGESQAKSELTISAAADVTNTEFYDCEIGGTLDGGNTLQNCVIGTLNYVNGFIHECMLTDVITLGGSAELHLLDCWAGVSLPEIDCGGSGRELHVRNYNGGIEITNHTGSDNVYIDLNAGYVVLDPTVTAGVFEIHGIGELEDNSTGTTIDYDGLISNLSLAEAVWKAPVADHDTAGSFGEKVGKKLLTLAKFIGLK